jgi:hypothetical protein
LQSGLRDEVSDFWKPHHVHPDYCIADILVSHVHSEKEQFLILPLSAVLIGYELPARSGSVILAVFA